MKDSVRRRLEAIERSVADAAPLGPVPVILQQGLGGPFMCEGVTFPTEEDALDAYSDRADVVIVTVVDGRKLHNSMQTMEQQN